MEVAESSTDYASLCDQIGMAITVLIESGPDTIARQVVPILDGVRAQLRHETLLSI